MIWRQSYRADPEARAIADRHYNRQKPGSRQFVPPGRCLVLVAPIDGPLSALWVTSYPFAEFVKHEWAGAWVCSCFRNECAGLSSDLIRQAVAATRHEWREVPELGIVTFVDPGRVKHKRDPGRCFLKAGFKLVGVTKERGLLAFQMLPGAMPEPEPAHLQQMALIDVPCRQRCVVNPGPRLIKSRMGGVLMAPCSDLRGWAR